MSIIAKEGEKKEFYSVPAGTQQAVCYDVWDIGFQDGEYKGEKKVQHKVVIGFEVNVLIPAGEFAGKRMTINKFYTLSLHEKSNLRKELEGWRAKKFTEEELEGFDVEKLIGVNCMLNVVHSDKGKAQVNGISKLMGGLMPLKPENDRSFPQWIKDFQAKQVPNPYAESDEDIVTDRLGEEVPF